MSTPAKVAIVTRLANTNAGNEALSVALINFVKDRTGGEVRAMDRYPRELERHSLGRTPEQAVRELEAAATDLADRARRAPPGPLADLGEIDRVTITRSARELPDLAKRFKRMLAVRRRLASLGLIESEGRDRTLRTLAWADLVIWNPAGEFHPTGDLNQPYRLMILMRAAQLLGARTAIVNHSLEVEDARLSAVLAHVYPKADFIAVRDAPSVAIAREAGVAAERVVEAPDLVFLTPAEVQPPKPGHEGAIGLAINGLQAGVGHDEWDALLDKLATLGRPVVFVSNGMTGDIDFAYKLAKGRDVRVVDEQPSYRELIELYRSLDVLISSRLHASIFALLAGAPVVSIEPQVFKLTAIFQQLAYPIQTENVQAQGWSDRVFVSVQQALGDRARLSAEGAKALERQRERIQAAYQGLFGAAG